MQHAAAVLHQHHQHQHQYAACSMQLAAPVVDWQTARLRSHMREAQVRAIIPLLH
jgi:hypothetical protein